MTVGGDRSATGMSREAFRPSALFLGFVALCGVSATMAWQEYGFGRLNIFLFVVSGWVVSLCLHEYAHALVAYRAGDLGVAERGYLTLDPRKYAHPVLSIVLPVLFLLLGGIGLPGGAVWLDRHAGRSRVLTSAISFAGPAVNLVLTLLIAAPFMLGVHQRVGGGEFWAGLAFLGFLQLTATVLNLLPVPGLDGGNMIEPWLNPQWQRGFGHVAPYGLLLVFAILWSPRAAAVFFGVISGIGGVLGLPDYLIAVGRDLFRFWG